jgi:hypothetical protein
MSVVLIGVSLASVVSGYTLVKFQGIVRRSEKPNDFWQEVMIYFLMGIAVWALLQNFPVRKSQFHAPQRAPFL